METFKHFILKCPIVFNGQKIFLDICWIATSLTLSCPGGALRAPPPVQKRALYLTVYSILDVIVWL